MTTTPLPLWFGPARNPGDDSRQALRYTALLSPSESVEQHDAPAADGSLLARLQSGEATAFDELYRRYVPRLLGYAERYVSADVAEDLVQRVMTAVWRRGHDFTVRNSIAAYLFGAMRREILHRDRHLRVVRRHERRDEAMADLAVPSSAPDAGATLEELRAALRRALDALPARTRDVLTLRWVEELRYDEIAEVLGISVSAAKMHVHRAQPIVRPLLEPFRNR